MSAAEEELVVELRLKLDLSLDDICEVMNRCVNDKLTRSSIYRALKRRGVKQRASRLKSKEEDIQKFEEVTKCGFIHMDVKYLTKLNGKRSYVYAAIDRMTRYVYVEILDNLEQKTAAAFVERFIKHFHCQVVSIITDNGFEWTDRCCGFIKPKGTGEHPVDQVCKRYKIGHRLTRIRRPQTNGMIERFNRRINEAIEQKKKIAKNGGKNSFYSHKERKEFINNFVYNYNRTRLRCLKYQAPIILLQDYMDNHAEYNTKA